MTTVPGRPAGTLEIAGVRRAHRVKRRFDAVITIEDPGVKPSRRLRFHRMPHPAHLVLTFEDLDRPIPPIITAEEKHIEAALDFARARPEGRLLVHCYAGISRSTAIALAIIADRLGPGKEAEALTAMLAVQPGAVPNLLVVAHADKLLGRNGALQQLVLEWDRPLKWNQYRRAVNRDAVLGDYPGY